MLSLAELNQNRIDYYSSPLPTGLPEMIGAFASFYLIARKQIKYHLILYAILR